MNKTRKFKSSQNAHKRLAKKHSQSKNDYKRNVLSNYHNAVVKKQKEKGRILGPMEKRTEYRNAEYEFIK